MLMPINEIAVLVVSILSVAVFHVWYSPIVFGNYWVRVLGFDEHKQDFSQKEIVVRTVLSIMLYCVLFTFIAWLIALGDYLRISVTTIFYIVYGVLVVSISSVAMWERKPFLYVLMHITYFALILAGGIAVLTYWPW